MSIVIDFYQYSFDINKIFSSSNMPVVLIHLNIKTSPSLKHQKATFLSLISMILIEWSVLDSMIGIRLWFSAFLKLKTNIKKIL